MADKNKNFRSNFSRQMKYRSDDYNQYGKYMVQEFTLNEMPLRFISMLGDIIIMLIPILLWLYITLFAVAGLTPVALAYAVMTVTAILVILFTVVGNVILSVNLKGQSFGKLALGYKVVNDDNSECDSKTLIIREAIGKEVPIILLYVFLGIKGLLAFIVIDGLCVVIDKKHRSIIDILLKTKVVILNPKGMRHEIVIQPEIKKPEPKVEVKAVNKIDLHIYSSFSHDGEFEVEDIFKLAKRIGLETISIADHNSVKGNIIAQRLVPLYGINYVPGINIDCEFDGYHVRLLGYFIDSNDSRYSQIEYENLAKEKAISLRRVQLFEEFTGLDVDQDGLLQHNRFQIISPEMIARNILNNSSYQKEKLLEQYFKGKKSAEPVKNFVADFFAPDKPAYVPIIQPKLEDMIPLVHATGGVAVLAHPMKSLRDDPEEIEKIIRLGIEGMEVFTPYHSLNDIKYLIELAKKYKLSVTSGSEFHGAQKKEFNIGNTNCPKEAGLLVQNFLKKYEKASENS